MFHPELITWKIEPNCHHPFRGLGVVFVFLFEGGEFEIAVSLSLPEGIGSGSFTF